MREIKFRAWDERKKEYYTDSQISVNEDGVIKHYKENDSWLNTSYIPQQYTGLKDKNGVEIYEGDILKTSTGKKYPDSDTFKVMFFHEERCAFGMTSIRNTYDPNTKTGTMCDLKPFNGMLSSLNREGIYVDSCGEILEVIGNIHQNPELLEK